MKIVQSLLLLLCAVLTLNSCLGVQADCSIRADGSGRIALEYRVSQMLETIGRLDGNESRPAIPVGRTDFERSIARIPGLRLVSFSQDARTSGGADLVTRVTVDFRDAAALVAFLDSTGSRASLIQQDGKNLLRLVLLEPASNSANADLLSLLREVSSGYEIGISLSVPGDASLTVTPPSVTSARIVPQGKKVSFAMGMGDIIGLEDGLTLEISW